MPSTPTDPTRSTRCPGDAASHVSKGFRDWNFRFPGTCEAVHMLCPHKARSARASSAHQPARGFHVSKAPRAPQQWLPEGVNFSSYPADVDVHLCRPRPRLFPTPDQAASSEQGFLNQGPHFFEN